jgi:hypothetical protein
MLQGDRLGTDFQGYGLLGSLDLRDMELQTHPAALGVNGEEKLRQREDSGLVAAVD